MKIIDFKVPLSGSKLFDINTYATARKLCNDFPGLSMEVLEGSILIHGELSDFWAEEYDKKLMELESIDASW